MFIAPAYAAAGSAAQPSMFESLFPMLIVVAIAYFLLIRPQQKKAKQQQAMLSALAKGDEVVTAGGLVGRVVKVDEQFFLLELADGVNILVEKPAVTRKLEQGTIKKAR